MQICCKYCREDRSIKLTLELLYNYRSQDSLVHCGTISQFYHQFKMTNFLLA